MCKLNKAKINETEREIKKYTITVGDFYILLSTKEQLDN